MMNIKNYYTLSFLLLLFCSPLLAQEDVYDDGHADFYCGDTIHGTIKEHISIENCEEETIITSLPEDGITGTKVYGHIEADKLKVIPGHTFVRIIPTPAEHDHPGIHTTNRRSRFRRRNQGVFAKDSSVTIAEAIIRIKKKNEELAKNIRIFPNPVQNKVKINSPKYPIAEYQITNQYGKIVKKGSLTPAKNQALSLSKLPKGLYVITLQLENNTVYRKTIIKY